MTKPTSTITADTSVLTTTDDPVLAVVQIAGLYMWQWCDVEMKAEAIGGSNDWTD